MSEHEGNSTKADIHRTETVPTEFIALVGVQALWRDKQLQAHQLYFRDNLKRGTGSKEGHGQQN
jgi:hypothetical protein